jgi:hypothetical protein
MEIPTLEKPDHLIDSPDLSHMILDGLDQQVRQIMLACRDKNYVASDHFRAIRKAIQEQIEIASENY